MRIIINDFMVARIIRWLRYFSMVASLLLPSLYVAILTFHQEMVPAELLLSMAASREAVPFPAIVEALLMEITFEALREAGVRLPKQIGSAVSIVGALGHWSSCRSSWDWFQLQWSLLWPLQE